MFPQSLPGKANWAAVGAWVRSMPATPFTSDKYSQAAAQLALWENQQAEETGKDKQLVDERLADVVGGASRRVSTRCAADDHGGGYDAEYSCVFSATAHVGRVVAAVVAV